MMSSSSTKFLFSSKEHFIQLPQAFPVNVWLKINQRQFSAGLLRFFLEPQNFRKEKKRQKFSLLERKIKLLGSLKDKRNFLYPFIRCLVEYIKHVHNFLSLFPHKKTDENGQKSMNLLILVINTKLFMFIW